MTIHRRRGRPARTPDSLGATPEMQRRLTQGETQAALDRLLLGGYLTPDEHWAGLHLRRMRHALNPERPPMDGFYWLPRPSTPPVCEETMARWHGEYAQARASLRMEGIWMQTLELVSSDAGLRRDWLRDGCRGCAILGRLWRGPGDK